MPDPWNEATDDVTATALLLNVVDREGRKGNPEKEQPRPTRGGGGPPEEDERGGQSRQIGRRFDTRLGAPAILAPDPGQDSRLHAPNQG